MGDGAKAVLPIHVMVDLETLGNGNDAAVVAIGAVQFSFHDLKFERKDFYTTIDPRSAQNHGLKIDADTVLWWMREDLADARKQTFLEPGALDLPSALMGFADWLPPKEAMAGLWGNGATFDNVILRSAYKACHMDTPWSFRVDKCFRTINQMFPMQGHVRKGTAHNALDDARNQTDHLLAIWERVQFRLDA